jgi:predicted small lipoprotein YifL
MLRKYHLPVRLVFAAALLATLAGCGGHGPGTTVSPPKPAAPRIHVRLTADSHQPRVGKPWHYEVRVTDAAGKPVPAAVHLQILFGSVPVGQVGRHRVRNGVWSETLGTPGNPPFPARARGIRLVFQAVATARGQTAKANYWIRVQ